MALVLSAGLPLDVYDGVAKGNSRLPAGGVVHFAVQLASSWKPLPAALTAGEIEEAIEDTNEAWRSWADEHRKYSGPFADWVDISGRVLQGLTFVPTGAIVAPPPRPFPRRWGVTQLGLPLLLGPGRQLHSRRSVGGGVSRRGAELLQVPHDGGELGSPSATAADHVRDRWGT